MAREIINIHPVYCLCKTIMPGFNYGIGWYIVYTLTNTAIPIFTLKLVDARERINRHPVYYLCKTIMPGINYGVGWYIVYTYQPLPYLYLY